MASDPVLSPSVSSTRESLAMTVDKLEPTNVIIAHTLVEWNLVGLPGCET